MAWKLNLGDLDERETAPNSTLPILPAAMMLDTSIAY